MIHASCGRFCFYNLSGQLNGIIWIKRNYVHCLDLSIVFLSNEVVLYYHSIALVFVNFTFFAFTYCYSQNNFICLVYVLHCNSDVFGAQGLHTYQLINLIFGSKVLNPCISKNTENWCVLLLATEHPCVFGDQLVINRAFNLDQLFNTNFYFRPRSFIPFVPFVYSVI